MAKGSTFFYSMHQQQFFMYQVFYCDFCLLNKHLRKNSDLPKGSRCRSFNSDGVRNAFMFVKNVKAFFFAFIAFISFKLY